MPHPDALTRLLQRVPLFQGLLRDELELLLQQAHKEPLWAGAYVLRQGEEGRDVYVVVSGELQVLQSLEQGQEAILAELKPGDSFGEMALLDQGRRSASVRCRNDALLLRLPASTLAQAPAINVKLTLNMARLMAQRLRGSNAMISLMLADQPSSERNPPSPLRPIRRQGG